MVLEPILGCGCALDLRIRVGGVVEHLMAPADPIYLDVGQAGEGRMIDIVLQTESPEAFAVQLALVADDAGRVVSGLREAPMEGGGLLDLRVDLLRVLRLRRLRAMQTDGDKGEEDEQAIRSHGRGLGSNLRAGFILDQAVSRWAEESKTVASVCGVHLSDDEPVAKMGHPARRVFILGRVCLRSVRWMSSWI
jgi:hypothetical protein